MVGPALQRVGLIGFGVVVAAILLEVGVRLLGLAPGIDPIVLDRPYATFVSSTNPILGYVPKPGVAGINRYGLRDYDYPVKKPAATYRILVLGDSIAFGYCSPTDLIAMDATFPKLLERRLNDPVLPGYDRVEVINLSVSGYGTLQEVEFLRVRGLALEPDLVLVAYCLNDSQESSTELVEFRENEEWGVLRLFGAEAVEAVFMQSHLVRAVWVRIQLLRSPGDDPAEPARDPRSQGFDELGAMSYESGFQTLIAIFPNLYGFSPYNYRGEHEETARLARARSFGVFDLLQPFNHASGGSVARVRGRCTSVHPDEFGHEVAARTLDRFLRRWLPTLGPAAQLEAQPQP